MLLSVPALAIGAAFIKAFTVTCTVSFPVAPLLSVTVSSYLYIPFTRLFTAVEAALAAVITGVEGPDIVTQL